MSFNYRLHQWVLQCNSIVNQHYQEKKQAELVAAISMIANIIKSKNKRKRRCWISKVFAERQRHGFYHAVLPNIRLEDLRFRNYTRMTPIQLEELLSIVGHDLKKHYVVREPINEEQRLIVTLRYLASGDSMVSLSYQFLISVSSITNIIRETCSVIWEHLYPIVLSQCDTNDLKEIANDFANKWNFPHCVGAIDGKHIVIQCPDNAGSEYYNYKGSHSIILLAISDANYIIRCVDIGAPGRQGDAGLFKNSAMGLFLERKEFNLPLPEALYEDGPILPYVLIGDEAFPLTDYMMRPYPGKNGMTLEKRIYNYRLSRARRTVENVFGILASQWRLLRRPILAKVPNAIKMIQAIVCLHNWLRKHDVERETYITQQLVDRPVIDGDIENGSWRQNVEDFRAYINIRCTQTRTYSLRAANIREEFCRFFNEEGEVGWQNIQIYK
ncbi:protein ANTAGONIST OF LIKE HETEROCHROMATIN PROTEIN 1-like [Temnothorax curvispinosus]|uniref:Protein ANTAGONIST OF LIKE HETEROCHROMATIN PROTEIN 1-like n=1 Tax=Temnothorax curvispinosus TaxID=300111 RepID=A0A6J1RBS5_9HYME|nr:protein ANTAGONIST OF LIKE HETEROCHROMATIN PROTEIN 1-like [Temnothorax curvispinosus]